MVKILHGNGSILGCLAMAGFFLLTTSLFLSNAYADVKYKYTCTCINPNGHTNKLTFGTNDDDSKACAAHCQKANYNSGVVTEGAVL